MSSYETHRFSNYSTIKFAVPNLCDKYTPGAGGGRRSQRDQVDEKKVGGSFEEISPK